MTTAAPLTPAEPNVRAVHEPHLLFICVLLLTATSRWGSYLHIPGIPVYLVDFVVLAAFVRAILARRRESFSLRSLRSAPRTGWLLGAFLAWAVLRTVTRTSLPMVAIRDFAPYGYAIAGVLTFLSPIRRGDGLRRWVYAALTVHALWYVAAIEGLVDPAHTWRIAEGATLFSTRPDFDGAIFGVAIAFAVHQVAFGPRARRPLPIAAMSAFMALNTFGLVRQHSRSGLLAAIVALGAVVTAWLLRARSPGEGDTRAIALRAVVAGVAVAAAVFALVFTLPGQRLVGGLEGSGESGGKSRARELVVNGVSGWLLDSPTRTAVGVGYGPNILARSKTIQYLEGTEFGNVRSPHNYLLGTWARLGLVGAALAAAMFIAAGGLAWRVLGWRTNPADVLAALLVLTIPVVALFGVILESPFGALPYFWAIGQLCGTSRRAPRPATAPGGRALDAPVSAGAEREGELLDRQ